MKQSFNLYYLYCMNLQCKISIYHRVEEIQAPLTVENLLATHACPCCNQPLVTAIDLEIKNAMAEVNQRKFIVSNYLSN